MNIMLSPPCVDGAEKQGLDERVAPPAAKLSPGAAIWTITGLSTALWMIIGAFIYWNLN